MNKIMTMFELSKVIDKIGWYQLFKIDNISYFEFKPSKFIDGVEIKVCDMSNKDHNKWETQIRQFTYKELENFYGIDK